jgi:hypothetical protein
MRLNKSCSFQSFSLQRKERGSCYKRDVDLREEVLKRDKLKYVSGKSQKGKFPNMAMMDILLLLLLFYSTGSLNSEPTP